MRWFFDIITRLSVRFRLVTFALVILVIVMGGVAASELQQELLPPVEFPQTIILAQVSGMTSDQVLNVVTTRLEEEIDAVPEVVNIESTTSSTIGAIIIASNDFGVDQQHLQGEIQAAIDSMWLPQRRIVPPEGADSQVFAAERLAELPGDVLLYLASNNSNFAFQLSPEVWSALNDETFTAFASYLATQTLQDDGEKTALQRLIEQELVPQLENASLVASVNISGGQSLPGEAEAAVTLTEDAQDSEGEVLLLQLTPDVRRVIAERLGVAAIDETTIGSLGLDAPTLPETIPTLPAGWLEPGFKSAADLQEMVTLTRSLGDVFNEFYETGKIVGALGQTDDLTPDDVTQLLAIEPSLVEDLNADQLAALPDDVFAALPDDYIDSLDGFTRDALAASSLATTLAGEAEIAPETLPTSWRIQPPQIITFSLSDLPLATFSIFSTGEGTAASSADEVVESESSNEAVAATDDTESTTETVTDVEPEDYPEGPELPAIYPLMGDLFGAEMDTADDLLFIQPSGELAESFGVSSFSAAEFFNTLTLFGESFGAMGQGDSDTAGMEMPEINIAEFVPALNECGVGLLDITGGNFNIAETLVGCLSPDAVAFLIENDPDFAPSLNAEVIGYFSLDVLALDGISPVLSDVWSTLANQPQFIEMPLATADDLIALGNGSVASVLNTINDNVPERFTGYEVRLFDSLTPTLIMYFQQEEPDFFEELSTDVLLKLSPEVLAELPEDVLAGLDDETRNQIDAIASGDAPSAAQELSDLYTVDTDIEPTDPDAPALGPTWQMIVAFIPGVDSLDNASDIVRHSEVIGAPAEFVNSFLTGQGASLAPDLIGELSVDALTYINERDDAFLTNLQPQALQMLQPDVLAALPQAIQERATADEIFIPTTQVTRANGNSSLSVTVYKRSDANTVEAFYAVNDIVEGVNAANDDIDVTIAFEQSSFIEESISGVVREGSLGAFFAVINILIFLSGGVWGRRGRSIVGALLVALSVGFLLFQLSSLNSVANGDLQVAWDLADPLMRVIGIAGIIAGLLIVVWPGTLPYPAWRSTIVIGISIPLSILAALAMMHWLPFEELTLNIMTLSGLTVAIGRVVDDSIVVLENIYREIERGLDKHDAIIEGTRDVSVAIFSATMIAVVVFLPLGFTGGIVGEFFLPFGLAVTYALAGSFVVAITVVPALASIFISASEIHEEEDSWMERLYVPSLKFALRSNATRFGIIIIALLSIVLSVILAATRPLTFLPDFGEPQISVSVNMPEGTSIIETNRLVVEMANFIDDTIPEDERSTIRETVGGSGFSFEALFAGESVSENVADITVGITSMEAADEYVHVLRDRAFEIFGEENVSVTAGSLTSEGFSGFELVLSGPDQAVLEELDPVIIETLNGIDGITNVESNLSAAAMPGAEGGSVTYVRIDQKPALSYTAELETEDTIGLTQTAIDVLAENVELPDGVEITQGFDSQIQTEGFEDLGVAILSALVIIIIILIVVFGSLVYWIAIIFSVIVAPVGAAIALTITDRVLGISAMIGLLMLLGLVITNAIVLIDRVNSNRSERGMGLYDALVEAGARRLRPILMTTIATIIALIPLSLGLSEGAIIAKELGTVVIGGVLSSMLLTLLVVPAVYYVLSQLTQLVLRSLGRETPMTDVDTKDSGS
ncbi:efflux RND transporter permease subunit [Phototrophicus methaneseepsis]|uniref:Efflux RND transporter permease subunit n=1 Tax=Phototrophicus methaneseepsis TaxID=2710758 RepID=A0A7S8IC79_9CHLR|nr:efflux RND transporter permease subunit [Phototrophicus methaneseepsis]QPC81255.1 efflux RND transporter permease subunit [Phototrophicus methaneseepsis]